MNIKKLLAVFLCLAAVISILSGCNVPTSKTNGIYSGNSSCDLVKNNKKLSGTVEGNYKVSSYDGVLGYGYNIVTEKYYNVGSIKHSYRVFDAQKLAKDHKILSIPITDTNVYVVTGTTATEYEKKLSGHAGISSDAYLFKADFSTSFTSSTNISSTKSFVKSLIHIGKKYEYVDLSSFSSLSSLEPYETVSFNKDINDSSVTPEDIFNKYGTHVLLDIEIGGRMELNYMYENTEKMNENQLEICARESYRGVTADQNFTYSDSTKKFVDSSEFTATQIGGTDQANITSLSQAQSAYGTWSKSLEDKNARLDLMGAGDIRNPYALTPIYEFAKDPQRKEAIRSGYDKYLEDNGNTYFRGLQSVETVKYVKGIYFGNNKDKGIAMSNLKAAMQCADDKAQKVILDKDLNNGAGGDFIYMGYILTTDKSQAITNLILDYKKKNNLPDERNFNNANYKKYNLDLTKGTGGDYYIMLYYTKDGAAGTPLTQIGLEYGNGGYTFGDMTGWTPVGAFDGSNKLDINKGAGGKYIYIWQKR